MSACQHKSYKAQEVEAIVRAITRVEGLVVGGQSINIWSEVYGLPNQTPWNACGELSSLDVDCLGDERMAIALRTELARAVIRSRVFLPETQEEKAGPNAALVEVVLAGQCLHIDVLHRLCGVSVEEARQNKARIAWSGNEIQLLNPVLCLQCKAHCLLELLQDAPEAPRQDRKHLVLSVANLRRHLETNLERKPAESLCASAARVIELAIHSTGLQLLEKHELDISAAIPWTIWQFHADRNLRRLAKQHEEVQTAMRKGIQEQREVHHWLEQLRARDRKRILRKR